MSWQQPTDPLTLTTLSSDVCLVVFLVRRHVVESSCTNIWYLCLLFVVDLPNEEDRAEILKILLKDEDHHVSIAELAKATEHYSGSDLKNVCVTAALKAVQEQVATNQPQVLNMEHFKEAIKMVPASSSDDMESLVELKKWDSKYGDGKKKKKPSIGFS